MRARRGAIVRDNSDEVPLPPGTPNQAESGPLVVINHSAPISRGALRGREGRRREEGEDLRSTLSQSVDQRQVPVREGLTSGMT